LSDQKSHLFIDYLNGLLAEEIKLYKDLKSKGKFKGKAPSSLPLLGSETHCPLKDKKKSV